MSFQITKPGLYRQRNGGKAEVFGKGSDGRWYGAEHSPMPCCSVWMDSGAFACDGAEGATDIVGEWIDAPDPGEGWRPLKDEEVVEEGDEFTRNGRVWLSPTETVGMAVRDARQRFIAPERVFYKRRIPQPFRVSEHGLGIYATRDGREATVDSKDGLGEWSGMLDRGPWFGIDRVTWKDDGHWHNDRELPNDLVRYIGPLPKTEPETWVRTNELQWRYKRQESIAPTLEQKWTCGDKSEWRPVEVAS